MDDEQDAREAIATIIGKRLGGVYTSRHTLLDCADAVIAWLAEESDELEDAS